MKTFLQFLDEKLKTSKLYGYGTSKSPSMLVSVVKPAKPVNPFKHTFYSDAK